MSGHFPINYDNTGDIFDLVQRAGAEYADSVFLRWEKEGRISERTYGDFTDRCHAFASFLQKQERPDGRALHVGLLGTGSDPFITALMGTMISGSVAVPMDMGFSEEELADALRRADIDIMFCDPAHLDKARAAAEGAETVRDVFLTVRPDGWEGPEILSVADIAMAHAGEKAEHGFSPDAPALIIFTSGTTGKRKGVLLSHGNLIDNLFNSEGLFHPEGEVYLNVLPTHHVYCIANDILWVFCYGRPLCLNLEMKQLIRHMQMFQPSIMFVVPAIAKGMHGYTMAFAKSHPELSLRQAKEKVLGRRLYKLFCGGGALPPQLSASLGEMGIMAAQGYGMSECSPKITYLDWTRPDKFTSVGKPAKRYQLRFVDGEIQVKGPSVMSGYYNDPEETAAIFTEDGWLRTGDVGYQDDEGFIYLTGRKKNIIVLSNGENVAPEPIEALFGDDRLIADIMVYAKDDQIAAEVYPDLKAAEAAGIEDIDAAVGRIIDRRNGQLPLYEQIKSWTVRSEPFPKTTSGKLVRPQYRVSWAMEGGKDAAAADTGEGRTDRILTALEGLTGRRPGADDDLFSSGLDSLGGILFLSELEKEGIHMKWDDLLEHHTVRDILQFADEKGPAAEAYPVQEVYPLTNMQIWFAHILRGNTTSNLPFLVKLKSGTDLVRLREAVIGTVDRHPGIKGEIWQDESGRFGYHRDDSKPVDVEIKEIEPRDWEREKEGLVRPYGYTKGEPIYRAVIYSVGDESYLFLDVGHIVSDGMTMMILFQDIESLYSGKEVEKEKYTYFDFVLDEQERNRQGLRGRDISYFTKQMKDLRITRSILTRRDFGGLEKGDYGVLRGAFSRITDAQVREFCRKTGISSNILFNAAFNYTVSLFRDEHDSACCTIHSGRTDGRWTRLAGPLFMSCYFRFCEKPGESVSDALARLAEQNRETMKCFVSNLKCDEMFFQYQGDFLRMNRYEKIWDGTEPLQLQSQPFHLLILSWGKGFTYELRYWKNRFDAAQLEVFLRAVEYAVLGMMTQESFEDIRRDLPQSLLPGAVLQVPALLDGRPVRVVNSEGLEQPVGGWGRLMVLDEGRWADSGRTARILPDGCIDDLDADGRTIMIEGLTGREFVDLAGIEASLKELPEVSEAECFVGYSPDNTMKVFAEVRGAQGEMEVWEQDRIYGSVRSLEENR